MTTSTYISITLAALVAALGAWLPLRHPAGPGPGAFATAGAPNVAPTTPIDTTPRATPGDCGGAGAICLEYRNSAYRFSLFAPNTLRVEEFNEGPGASTITFSNVASGEGFQIFVAPYESTQVSMERFNQDEPSGVMKEPQQLSIDGASATMFFSRDELLGQTREVWFIHGGYLFEVTTPKVLDADLAKVMQSWKFI